MLAPKGTFGIGYYEKVIHTFHHHHEQFRLCDTRIRCLISVSFSHRKCGTETNQFQYKSIHSKSIKKTHSCDDEWWIFTVKIRFSKYHVRIAVTIHRHLYLDLDRLCAACYWHLWHVNKQRFLRPKWLQNISITSLLSFPSISIQIPSLILEHNAPLQRECVRAYAIVGQENVLNWETVVWVR